ncbi:transforming growth factor beta activator LRRC32-like [Ambystoma mexicanum]|uniref:transforming growth factor beta activator LRRC32-like n=1 Tax=Ambystoma mexicanum TaxID=8296 RepID=UPI0037E76DF1
MRLLASSLAQPRTGRLLLLLLGLSAGMSLQPITARVECRQNGVEMTCHGQGLPSLPQDLRPDVQKLDVSHNSMRTLSAAAMARLHALEHLDASCNGLVTIEAESFREVTPLRSLILASNFLDREYVTNARAFRSLHLLRTLDLSANNMDSDMVASYLANTTSLEELNLSLNKMGKLTLELFRGAPKLRTINLQNSLVLEIEVGTFESLENLQVLNLAKNHIRCVASFRLTRLQVLNLSSNAIELFLTGEDSASHDLKVLDLSHNRLHHFPVLPKVHHIQHLNLSGNSMTALLPGSMDGEEFSEAALWYEEAHSLDLSHSILSRRTSQSTLRDLDLSRNHLNSFPVNFLHTMKSLQILNMAMNCLGELIPDAPIGRTFFLGDVKYLKIYHAKLESLRNLDLHANDIHVVPRWLLEVNPKLETIDLAQNSIVPCPTGHMHEGDHRCTFISGIANLKHLSLRGNGLRSLSPYTFNQTNLITLDLSENKGLVMSRDSLVGLELSLQTLYLRGNQLNASEIDLPCLKALKVLDLSDNQIEVLPPSLECSPVESLDIRNNHLRTVQPGVAGRISRTLESLFISGNPFECCRLTWLDRLRAARVHILDLAEAECMPDLHNSSSLSRVYHDQTGLCPPPLTSVYIVVALALLLALLCGIFLLLKKARSSGSFGFRGSRVASSS